MNHRIYYQALGVWCMLAVLTVMYGAFREAVFIPITGMNGTLARAVLLPVTWIYIWITAWLFLKRTHAPHTQPDALRIGMLWLVLTIAFEFVFGSLVMGNSIQTLLADYNLLRGRTWGLFLLFLAAAPWLIYKQLHK